MKALTNQEEKNITQAIYHEFDKVFIRVMECQIEHGLAWWHDNRDELESEGVVTQTDIVNAICDEMQYEMSCTISEIFA